MMAINSNGKVSTCNVDWDYSGVVGDIHKQRIKDIWNGKQIKRFRKYQLERIWNNPLCCEKCVVWVSTGNIWSFLKSRKEFI
jgi:radical SAM protein with 4Fe4S-binding SPASM domain